MTHWYEPLRAIVSLGSQADKISHMGELHAARQRHLSQFFTTDAIARQMWGVVDSWRPDRKVSVLDNSVGSARLLQFADPAAHTLYGVDVHEPTIAAVQQCVEAAGFEGSFRMAGMEEIHPRHFDVAIINPPFSIHLESPHLQPFCCTTWGRFGANSSALSHEYALAQALEAAQVVVALLPTSFVDRFANVVDHRDAHSTAARRVVGIFDLPASAFREEGATVHTSIAVFGRYRMGRVVRQAHGDFTVPLPGLDLNVDDRHYHEPRLNHQVLDDTGPAIMRPVTSQKRVRIANDGRRIVLGFECGFVEAMVLNRLLERRILPLDGQRLPHGMRYAGSGRLDLEAYLVQDDPMAALGSLLRLIRDAGGVPELAPGFLEHFGKRLRRSVRQATPLRHTVWTTGVNAAEAISGVALKSHVADPLKWGSPVIKAGEAVAFVRQPDGRYAYQAGNAQFVLTLDELMSRFAVSRSAQTWETVHEGLSVKYPGQALALRLRMQALGIDRWLNWEFQQNDLVELLQKPCGAVAAWEQGCGKSRLAAALILLAGVKHGLIVVEARLVPEMRAELAQILPPAAVHVIDSPESLGALGQINLIAYERLRMPVCREASRRVTYAHRLRRRIGLLVADEGERLSNPNSDQSRALWQLSARRRYILTGSPIANYPRDVFGLIAFTGGDGTAAQPYGYRRGYLDSQWLATVQHAQRGVDRFRDDFVVLEWVTWEFAESLQDGAKREVPKIGNLPLYRQMLAPHVKRRLVCEPDVARYIQIDPPAVEVVETDWDPAHLSLYLRTADEFAEWYREIRRTDGRSNNLIAILARIRAVHFAANYPQYGVDGVGTLGQLTSKQRAVIDRLNAIAEEGKQAILFAENPRVIDLIAGQLKARGVETVPFHGGIPITKRVADKDKRFVNGSATGLLCTKGSGRAGYNLPNADYVLFYDRSWTWRIEYQAMRRALRWNRKGQLKVVYFHLPGSIDKYQDQMVAHKRDAMEAGLDWATPELEDEAFLHMDTLLDAFVEDLAALHGRENRDQRQLLKEAA
ncbi:DEAD/DEAH box helicase [Cupriavidus taiwanensis]|uniref:DEAD/DEAH box helicase n=1 Tax=Cupriavidus taiwanensis TaxID=164546 RepID=UPI000E11E7C3|nr:DEAD/DEAH box helicase [Cupriavidus taiwanensis]SPC24803.1 Helicase superfamily protein II [Cupriavidus taiwanensis]